MKYPSLFHRLLANSIESDEHSFEGTPCWCWAGTSWCRQRWYGRLNIWTGDRTKTVQAHRLMAEIVLGRTLDPELETIEHACEHGPCINPWHFKIATRANNVADMQRRRHNRPRLIFTPLLDVAQWGGRDAFARVMPYRLGQAQVECPF